MAKQINVGVGGVVKKVKEVPLGIGGVVKKAKSGKCGIGGVVKTFFESELVLYDTGTQYYTINNTSSATITFNSSSISIAKPSNYANSGVYTLTFAFATGNLDLSQYTKCYVQASINGYLSYTKARVGVKETSDATSVTYYSAARCIGTDSTTLYEIPIDTLSYTYDYLWLDIGSSKSSDGTGTQGGIRGTIYKIWLE